MSASPPPRPARRPHLAAGLGALTLLVLGALGFNSWSKHAERAALLSLFPIFAEPRERAELDPAKLAYIEQLKNQGITLQQRGFERPDMLPVYGSSELVKPVPGKATVFFLHCPTGFFVFPVGKAGTTSLIIVQKLASLGDVVRGRRVAICVSPSWFFPAPDPDHAYRGNYSGRQTFAALVNPGLSFEWKRDFARCLLRHSATPDPEALLGFLVKHLARGTQADRLACAAAAPLARLNLAVYATQDHFEIARYFKLHERELGEPPKVVPEQLDWDRLIAQAPLTPRALAGNRVPDLEHKRLIDQSYREAVEHAPAWDEFASLLRGLDELGAQTLVLGIPPDRVYLKRIGVSDETLDRFATRIRSIAAQHHAELEDFEDHAEDPAFFIDHRDHLSAKGWMYFNRALDHFYHSEGSTRGNSPRSPRRQAAGFAAAPRASA